MIRGWNKGLTKDTDEGLKKNGEKIREAKKGKKTVRPIKNYTKI